MDPHFLDELHKTDRFRIVFLVIIVACFWLVLSLSYGPEKRDTVKCKVIATTRDRYGVRVCVGMTKDEVVKAVGFPAKVVSADRATDLREQWIYSTHDGRPKRLYFEKELLVSIEE